MPAGEFDLIDRYFASLSAGDSSLVLGPGDDAAIIRPPAGDELLMAVDTLVKDVHFLADTPAFDLGYKSLAVNASDIAAMGGVARWATLSLTLEEVNESWLADFAAGFAELANAAGIQLVGGDTTRGPLAISVQLTGTIEQGKALTRSGAKSGDLVYVSGYPGLAACALASLQQGDDLKAGSLALERLQRPLPRLELGRHLVELASAAIDVSDGLAADLGHILRSSGCAAEIELENLPVAPELALLEDDSRCYEFILGGGDDYELCFTAPPAKKEKLVQLSGDLDYPLHCVGSIVEGEGLRCLDGDGNERQLSIAGWQHF